MTISDYLYFKVGEAASAERRRGEMEAIKKSAEEKMKKAVKALEDEFKTIRTGRASAALFENIRVDYYEQKVPLNQVATISIPEARLVIIQPWDRSVLAEIEKAIQKSELSVNPNNDGKVIRIAIPPLTEERRKELAKVAKNIAEKSRVSIRNVRRTQRGHQEEGEGQQPQRGPGQAGHGRDPETHRQVHRGDQRGPGQKDKEIMEI
jgi:ribosome recycling factor